MRVVPPWRPLQTPLYSLFAERLAWRTVGGGTYRNQFDSKRTQPPQNIPHLGGQRHQTVLFRDVRVLVNPFRARYLNWKCEDRAGPDRSHGRRFHRKPRKDRCRQPPRGGAGARLTVFSELAICGYPPADFLEKPSFLARCRSAVDELAAATRDLPQPFWRRCAARRAEDGKPAFNAAVLLDRGQLLLEQHKRLLPFYDVFDEQRYFSPSDPRR